MKTILILRHAKSDWSDESKIDFDRPLAKRGQKDAPRMGEVLALFNAVPDTILASPALRAKQTAQMVAKSCDYQEKIQWEESFYGGSSPEFIAAFRRLPNSITQPMVVGHNPGLEELAATLCTAPVWKTGNEAWSIKIPTAGLVCIDLDIETWANLEPGDGILRWFLIPKLVKSLRA